MFFFKKKKPKRRFELFGKINIMQNSTTRPKGFIWVMIRSGQDQGQAEFLSKVSGVGLINSSL
jgi:hypothetical protein